MKRDNIESLTTAVGVILGVFAAACFIPASRGKLVELAQDKLRDFDELDPKKLAGPAGSAAASAAVSAGVKQLVR